MLFTKQQLVSTITWLGWNLGSLKLKLKDCEGAWYLAGRFFAT